MSFPDNQPTLPHFPQEPLQPLGEPRRSRASRPVVAGLMVAILSALVGAAIAHLAWSGPGSTSHTPAATTTPGTFGPFSGNAPSQGGGGSQNGGSASPSTSSSTVSSVAARVDPALVDVNTVLSGGDGAAGTGQVVTSNGEVITNNHVISGATTITATDLGNGRTYTARVIGYDETQDVAVIQLEGASGLKTVSLGNSSTVHVGQSVITIGNAGGVGGTPSAVGGTVTGLGKSITATDEVDGSSENLTGLIEINGGLEPGDSGGPLVNTSGQVVGMDTAASSSFSFQSSSSEGFAIPIDEVRSVAREIVADDTSNTLLHLGATPLIGVDVCTDPQECAVGGYGSGYGYSGNAGQQGAYVGETVAGSPAAVAGITAGSWITGLAGHTVTSPTSLVTLKNRYHPGARVSISWVDANGNSHTGTVTFTSGPPD